LTTTADRYRLWIIGPILFTVCVFENRQLIIIQLLKIVILIVLTIVQVNYPQVLIILLQNLNKVLGLRALLETALSVPGLRLLILWIVSIGCGTATIPPKNVHFIWTAFRVQFIVIIVSFRVRTLWLTLCGSLEIYTLIYEETILIQILKSYPLLIWVYWLSLRYSVCLQG